MRGHMRSPSGVYTYMHAQAHLWTHTQTHTQSTTWYIQIFLSRYIKESKVIYILGKVKHFNLLNFPLLFKALELGFVPNVSAGHFSFHFLVFFFVFAT